MATTTTTTTATSAADVAEMVVHPDPTSRRKRNARAINRRRCRSRSRSNHLPSLPPRESLPDLNFPVRSDERPKEGMRFVLQKELRNSDVSTLGRIVLPKKEAEANLPVLTAKDGFTLPMVDMITGQEWIFKYRFWPNNKSRMYVLENVGQFTKAHDLQLGDYILVFKDVTTDKYVICAKKKALVQVPAAVGTIEDGIFDSIVPDIVVASANYSDLYCPFYDGMGMPFGLSSSFSPDLPMNFIDENVASSSAAAAAAAAEHLKPMGSTDDVFLGDFP